MTSRFRVGVGKALTGLQPGGREALPLATQDLGQSGARQVIERLIETPERRLMILDELLDTVKAYREVIRTSFHPNSQHVQVRMDVSARHVSACFLGSKLEASWRKHGDVWGEVLPTDHATVDTAGKTLVFGAGMTALDLCASALLHWQGATPHPGKDFDMNSLSSPPPGIELPDWGREWKDETKTSHNWQSLKDYRDAQLHRMIRQSVTVHVPPIVLVWPPDAQMSGAPGRGWSEVKIRTDRGGPRPAEDKQTVFSEVPRFVRKRWEAFWCELVRDARFRTA